MKKSASVRACLFMISLLIGVGCSEMVVRLADVHVSSSPFWHFHPLLGWTQSPNSSYEYELSGDQVQVEYNSLGFRDAEHELEKPAGTKRVVLIGDSYSEGVEVNVEETFLYRLGTLLNKESSEPWEVINLAMGDFGTTQELLTLKNLGLPYSPDLVIFQIFPLNDICNNSIELFDLCKSSNDPLRPYFIEHDGELVPVRAQPVRSFLRGYLASYRLLEQWWLSLSWSPDGVVREEKRLARLKERGFPPLDPLLYTFVEGPEMIEPVAEGWRLTELILSEIVGVTRRREIPLVAMVVPFEARVGSAWEAFASTLPPPTMSQDYPERRLEPLLRRLGVWPVLMKPVFEQHPDKFFPTRGGHFNPEAHRLTAEAIYATLEEHSFIP